DAFGTPSHPHLLMQAGKDGVVRLLDRDDLGGMGQGNGGTDADLSEVRLRGLWGRMAAFASDAGNFVFLVPRYSPLQALRVSADADGVPRLSVVAASSEIYGFMSGSPIVTSDGSSSGSAVIWVMTTGADPEEDDYLRAYGLPPKSGTWAPLASWNLGPMAKFTQPATADGRLYVGTLDGRVLAFGRPISTALSAPSTEFGQQPVGQTTSPQDVTVTAVKAVTVNDVHTSAPFTIDAAALTLPMTLAAGETFTVPVTFTPDDTGAVTGSLELLANAGATVDDTYAFALHGIGTAPGLAATPTSADFPDTSLGMAAQLGLIIQNTSSSSETIESVSSPASGPFSILDTDGGLEDTTLSPQESITLTIQFAPTAVGSFTDELQIAADQGPVVTVPVSGRGIAGAPMLSSDTTSLNFGNVAPGKSSSLAFVVTNSGTSLLTITKAGPPAPPFVVPAPIAEGQTVSPGDSLTVHVTFTPTSAEPVTDKYLITGDDGKGSHAVTMAGNQQAWRGAISSRYGCLELARGQQANGTRALSAPCLGVTKQLFAYDPSRQAVHVASIASTWCLDVANGGTSRGTPVQFWTCNGSGAQRWVWRADNSLYNRASGKCLNVPKGATGSNVALTIDTCARVDEQSWDLSGLLAARGAMSAAVAAANQICLDDTWGRTRNATPIQTWRCNLTPAQIVTHTGNTLRVLGHCLDVAAGRTTNGTGVQLFRCNATPAQEWKSGADGRLVNVRSGKCLDVPGGSAAPGMRLQIFTCNGTAAQRWSLPG
ncbi:MAG TPA: ricin-type beta-trefoil lectin domain protein, partial [Jatrophihabitans sp.]|nr:ricin-type beta-trefoil lectin domain protein [Jatrophihabitans sp.]